MRGVVYKFVMAALAGGVVAALGAFFLPVRSGLVLDVYLLFLGGIGLLALVRATGVAQPGSTRSPFDRALREPKPRSQRPPDLVRLEQQVALAATTAFDVHYRLRPLVREIASQRLWRRHAVDLEHDQKRAQALLGEDVWELVSPDRLAPDDPFAPGLAPRSMRIVVDDLERV
jgi:hypothetical protein